MVLWVNLDYNVSEKFDLSLIQVVLININHHMLSVVYGKFYDSSNKYILVCKYYNSSSITISYRRYEDRLFKKDFA